MAKTASVIMENEMRIFDGSQYFPGWLFPACRRANA